MLLKFLHPYRFTPFILILSFGLLLTLGVSAQEDYSYKRSSLQLVFVDQSPYPYFKPVVAAFYEYAFPEKYDPIGLKDTALMLAPIYEWSSRGKLPYENEQRIKDAFIKSKGNIDKWMVEVMSPDEELVRKLVLNYIDEKDLARKIVAQWFERDENGTFSMGKIMERGRYSASMLDAKVADGSAMGKNLLRDAGNELIMNSFILFTNLTLIDNHRFVKKAEFHTRSALQPKAHKGALTALKHKTKEEVSSSLNQGHMIWTTGYLFRLKWNEEIENTFYSEMWLSRGEENPERKALFETTDLFELEYVGNSYAQSVAAKKLLQEDSKDALLTRLTLRNIEACYNRLQKTYDVFKTKTPLLSVNPASAQIGMKEGLEGGERFEVLEVREDPDTGIQSLHRVGVIQVDKNKIWDNRFGADELLGADNQSGRTYFTGSGNYLPGMLIRQIK
jgi:hypothetical protein